MFFCCKKSREKETEEGHEAVILEQEGDTLFLLIFKLQNRLFKTERLYFVSFYSVW